MRSLSASLRIFHALNQHLVGIGGVEQRCDGRVEIGMFLPLGRQLGAKCHFLFFAERHHLSARPADSPPNPVRKS